MDKKHVYCRYCGKLIDRGAPFCTYCGKKQGGVTTLSSVWTTLYTFFRKSRFSKIIFKPNGAVRRNRKKWAIVVLVLVAVLIVARLLGPWLYGLYLTKEDERRESIALKDITKADEIARELFQEEADEAHRFKILGCIDCCCDFDHVERGIAIVRNAAEKGNAKAQFTLGCIYAGARYDRNDITWGTSCTTMMDTEIDNERAAYWFTLAAEQGHGTALSNLGNAYRYGNGVEKDLIKATELTKTAAELGNRYGQLNYGDMHRDGDVRFRIITDSVNGECVIIDGSSIEEAKKWWTEALKNDDEDVKERARERLEQLYE